MDIYWDTYPPFSADELDGKTVEFDIESDIRRVVGLGTLLARSNPEGFIFLQIEIVEDNPKGGKTQFRYGATERLRFRSERHPNQDVAAFRLSSYILPAPIPDPR